MHGISSSCRSSSTKLEREREREREREGGREREAEVSSEQQVTNHVSLPALFAKGRVILMSTAVKNSNHSHHF